MWYTSIATNHWKKTQDGTYTQETTWHSLKFFGGMAKKIKRLVERGQAEKGTLLYVEGRTAKYKTQKDGVDVEYVDVIVNDVQPTVKATRPDEPMTPTSRSAPAGDPEPVDDDDIPF
jgi:single-stranded DNA-binding protein